MAQRSPHHRLAAATARPPSLAALRRPSSAALRAHAARPARLAVQSLFTGAPAAAPQPPLSPPRRRRSRASSHSCAGIVQGTARVAHVDARPDGTRSFDVAFPGAAAVGAAVGASVALNGTCLTVVAAPAPGTLRFDVIPESLRRTNLGLLVEGDAVNYERSARVGDEVGGHTVSGHVHTTAVLAARSDVADSSSAATTSGAAPREGWLAGDVRLEFRLADASYIKYVLPKGFVAVDGCSLTVGEVSPDGFSVYLIPETLRATTLGGRAVGNAVNIEVEAATVAVVDTVERAVAAHMARRGLGDAATAARS